MSLDPDEILVGQNGSINVVEYGVTLPTSISAPLAAPFIECGYADEDGITFTDGKTVNDVMAWQEFYPARKLISAREGMVSFNLLQWNRYTVQLAFGGGTVTEGTSGEYTYSPPSPETIDYRSVVIEWQDGAKDYRLVIPKAMVTENVETNLVRTEAAVLPITLSIVGVSGNDPWYLLTDDPSFDTDTGAS